MEKEEIKLKVNKLKEEYPTIRSNKSKPTILQTILLQEILETLERIEAKIK
tara:strand:+ start:203 stop:355 length:153 start_codon:yes stop_codon:yes gene_type:complete